MMCICVCVLHVVGRGAGGVELLWDPVGHNFQAVQFSSTEDETLFVFESFTGRGKINDL